MKELLEAGVHFGHQVRRWNPKMKEYIYGERNGIYIIDLQKTQKLFRDAIGAMQEFITERPNRTILFVGTKRQAQDAIKEEAERAGQYYINNRWLGGLLTNFQTVQKSIKRLKEIEAMREDGRYDSFTKKERLELDREHESLNKNLAGIKAMNRLPDALFIIDVKKEEIAVAEANRLGIPVWAVVDTNCSPEGIDHVIPGNDDALRAIRLFAARIADAVLEGQQVGTEGGVIEAQSGEDTGLAGVISGLDVPPVRSADEYPAPGAEVNAQNGTLELSRAEMDINQAEPDSFSVQPERGDDDPEAQKYPGPGAAAWSQPH
jgi:small subunit ribosomal protein S2